MTASPGKQLRDGVLGVGSIGAVVAGMAAIDGTVRGSLVGILRGEFPIALTMPDVRLQHIARMLTDTMGLPSGNLVPLVGFALAGVALFVLMFRT